MPGCSSMCCTTRCWRPPRRSSAARRARTSTWSSRTRSCRCAGCSSGRPRARWSRFAPGWRTARPSWWTARRRFRTARASSRPCARQAQRARRRHPAPRARRARLGAPPGRDRAPLPPVHRPPPRDLPNPPVYSKVNPSDAPVLTLGVTSRSLPLTAIEDLVNTRLVQKIAQLPGVGLVTLSGGQKPAVRIQVNPARIAANGLTMEEVRAAVAAANVNQANGSLDGPLQSFTIAANDQILQRHQYRALVIAYRNNAPLLLSDVADVIDGAENVRQAAWMGDEPAIIVNIQRQPGANLIEVVDRVKQLLPQLQSALPSAVQVTVLTDRTTTIRASVHDVQF